MAVHDTGGLMDKNVVIISTAETFSVRGIEMKLKGIDADCVYCAPRRSAYMSVLEKTSLIVLYTDDDIVDNTEMLIYIMEHCAEKNGSVMVIGSKNEYESVKNLITESYVSGFFERPLVMEQFVDAVENYFSSDMAKRKNILIVDDNVTYMSMIMDWLRDSYRVFMANSGVQAITWLAKNRADLILLDYEMPVTSGPQVLEMIRSEPATADIPVIFLTGVGDKESIMKVLALKPAAYLLKTIDRKGLHETLDNFFNSGQ